MDKLRKEIRDLKDEGIEKLIHLSYDRLADGGRHPYKSRRIDPDQEAALKRLFEEKGGSYEDL